MKVSFVLKETFEAEPSVIYDAWLDSTLHSEMTGGEAHCTDKAGDPFSTWDGYITGRNIELIKDEKIVQSWRTTEFHQNDDDSILTIELTKKPNGGTELTLAHSNIPEGQTQYEQGWIDNYFVPMKDLFSRLKRESGDHTL